MKHFVIMALSFCALFSTASRADVVAVGVGIDGAASLGEHVSAEAILTPDWSLGLQLGQHQYRAAAGNLDTIATQEVAIFGKHTSKIAQNVALFQSLAVGQVALPADASQAKYNVIDLETGLRLETGRMFTELGFGLRDNLIDAPVRIGMGGVAQKYAMYPTVSIGTTF